jgi:hypothetical protein
LLLAPYGIWLAPAGLFAWRAWKATTRRATATWLALFAAWAVVLVALLRLAIDTSLDTFALSLTLTSVAVAALLIWLVLRPATLKRRVVWLAVLCGWLAISVPFFWIFDSPYVTFEAATIKCGHEPVIATNFAAGYSYTLPGDAGYGPNMFNNTYYCSAADAEAAGYRRLPPR